MPHVIVKAWPGKTERQKQELADRIARDVIEVLGYGVESVSVAIEEVSAQDWAEQVYRADIQHPRGKLYRKPGYSM
jgi:4-oxalocrotonate tautomerase